MSAESNTERSRGIILLDLVPQTLGWLPVKHLVGLLQRFLDAEVVTVTLDRPAVVERLSFTLRRRRKAARRPQLLVVAPQLRSISRIGLLPGWRDGFERVSVWLIDSFWTDGLNGFSGLRNVDHLFITWGGDLDAYRTATAATVDWLPWGTDALHLGSAQPGRSLDVLRLGRQPAAWDDDTASRSRFEAAGLAFNGRPAGNDAIDSYTTLLTRRLPEARCVMAHSNFADDERYTHPTKEYLTARWTDAFACGCMVAGAQPRTDPLFARIDPGAVIDLDLGAADHGFSQLCAELGSWNAQTPRRIHEMALRELDWRWRIRDLARRLERPTGAIDVEISQIWERLTLL
jgi:hypothetical protein